MDGRSASSSADERVAALAGGQHGLVARRQLVGLGIGRGAIEHRLRCGRLHRVQRGVYAVGHRVLSAEGRWLAAVLACGPAAVLSHRSAAALWAIRPSASPAIEVTVQRCELAAAGVRLHHARLPPDEVTRLDGIPVTTLARTQLDLAAVLGPGGLRRAFHEAEVLRLFDGRELERLLRRHPRARGRRLVLGVLAELQAGAAVSRRELEARTLALAERAGLPSPETNLHVEAAGNLYEADLAWPERRLIAELDGHATHATRTRFETDRLRDRKLATAGWQTIRITWRQLERDPAGLEQDLRALLS
jgi:predicted transcriptional regulator of viral defense system